MSLVKINNFNVKPLPIKGGSRNFKGSDLFKRQFFNMSILAHTNSGKTTVISNLLDKFVDRYTLVMIFCSTIDTDESWKYIIKSLENKGVPVMAEHHFIERGVNYIDEWLEEQNKSHKIPENEEQEEKKSAYMLTDEQEKSTNTKKSVPLNYIIIFDDLSSDLRNKSIDTLLKKSRHYRAKVIISSQALTDIQPSSHSQIYCLLLFKGLSRKNIEYITKRYPLWIEFDEFWNIYKSITDEPYQFMTLIPMEREVRKNLNEKFVE